MKPLLFSAVLGALVFAPSALAEEHVIEMRNVGPDASPMVFAPDFIEAQVGDTIVIVNGSGAHNAQTIEGMWPDGADTFIGEMNQDVTFTVTHEGYYGIKCLPHYQAGMVMLIKVGDGSPNHEAARAVEHPGRAATRMDSMWARAEAAG